MTGWKRVVSPYQDVLLVWVAYGVVYTAYHLIGGVNFDAGPLGYYMQYLDPALLQHDLLRSLWYLHAQPPLMDLIPAIALKLCDGHPEGMLMTSYAALGLADLFWLTRALELLAVRRSIKIGILLWLLTYPTFILYANWVYTPHLECSMVCWLLYGLARLFHTRNISFQSGVQVFIPCMMLELLRPQWSVLFFLVMLGMIVWHARSDPHIKSFILGSLTALLPVGLWFCKNYLVFGLFAASSWGGMNLAQMVPVSVPPSTLNILRERGDISPFYPIAFNLDKAQSLRDSWEQAGKPVVQAQHPALDRKKSNGNDNHNYLPYIEATQQDMKDSLAVIAYAPMDYLRELQRRMQHVLLLPTSLGTMMPAGMYPLQAHLKPYQPALSTGSVVFYGACPLFALLLSFWPKSLLARHRPLIMIGVFLALMIAITSSAMTYGGESERMRWGMVPFYLMFVALLLEQVMVVFRIRKK